MRRLRILALALVGCSSYSSTSSPPADAGSDALAPPPPPPAPTDGGGDDAGAANLLFNGGFEQGCAGWATNTNVMVTADTTARTGSGSCRMCYGGNGPNANLFQNVTRPLVQGSRYSATVWVRSAPGGAAGTMAYARVNVTDDQGMLVMGDSAGHFDPTDSWQRIDATFVIPITNGVQVGLDVVLNSGCVLVDDASLVEQ